MANINSTSLRNNLVQSLTMSGNLTWAKADFKGKFTVFLSATGATRTLTISNTGFVAGDFICLLISQVSSTAVGVTIGGRNINNNIGTVISAIFDGTNWSIWCSGGSVNNTGVTGFNRTSYGLSARTIGDDATAIGFNTYAEAGTTAIGRGATGTGVDSTCVGYNSTSDGTSSTANGRSAISSGSISMANGAYSNTNSFVRSNAMNAYARSRRYGSTRFHLGTTTSTSDATNPTQNKEWATWNGTTTNATITEIFLRGVSSNRCVLQAKNVLSFSGQCVAFRSDYTGSARWTITGLIKRDGSNVTTLIGVTATLTHSDGTGGTLVLTIDADDTNESLRVQVTGNASETWTWLVELELLDLRIA